MIYVKNLIKKIIYRINIHPLTYEEAIEIGFEAVAKFFNDVKRGKTKRNRKILVKYIKTEILNEKQKLLTKKRYAVTTAELEEISLPCKEIWSNPFLYVLLKEIDQLVIKRSTLSIKHKFLYLLLRTGYSRKEFNEICNLLCVEPQKLLIMWEELKEYVILEIRGDRRKKW